jgi:pimeloyl-ACP methyl ester carboxylesterase
MEQHGRVAPVETMAREIRTEDPLPGIDTIESWGANAVELVGTPEKMLSGLNFQRIGQIATGQEIRGLVWTHLRSPAAIAFHAPEALVADVSGLQEVIFTESGSGQQEPIKPFTEQASFIEWRAYIGSGTLIAEGESELLELSGREPARSALIRLVKAPALLVGRVLRWMGRPVNPTYDPFYSGRLKYYEKKLAAVANAYGHLSFFHDPDFFLKLFCVEQKPGPVMVFIHGAFSCSLPHLALLHPLSVRTFRFEHDTFRSISKNAADLSYAVLRYLKPDPLYLVAHSRGGLVARLVARELAAKGMRVIVRTYGTPHRGTPLANAGEKFLNALLAMGRAAASGVFAWDPASLAGKAVLKALLRSRTLPEGLEVMRTDSEMLKSWLFGSEPFELLSYGGNYDLRTLADGACAYALGEMLHEGFARQQNDMVVPTDSALGAGNTQPVLDPCDHFQYFSTEVLKQELQKL